MKRPSYARRDFVYLTRDGYKKRRDEFREGFIYGVLLAVAILALFISFTR